MRTKYASTRFSIVKRSKGQSAVDAASYISRSVLVSEYDGKTYRPKYHEDLVHCEINLPEYAPEEWLDRAVLWNSVELNEKQKNAQLCRTLKAALPNDWSYELAEETVRDYVQRNFVSKGMCADWAIHDSVNQNGIHNLHFHLMLTLRPVEENGKWGAKQRKEYILDKDGNKIRNKSGRGFKSRAVDVNDWNEKGNSRKWRKDLTDTINVVNDRIGLPEYWEHRSFKELGLEQVSDEGAIAAIVDEVLAENPQSVADFKAGKDRAIGFLVGQVMKKSRGKANPGMVNKLLVEKMQ